ncbi:MAG: hypothetical protein LBV16_01485 [Elusimicrobiota bacterium]|jgi:hypothetical protein|nr:hypothetical protein [Elusimicrobiota bacterium]
MKNILKAVSLFAVVVFVSFAIVGCSKDSKDPVTGLPSSPNIPTTDIPSGGNPTLTATINAATSLNPSDYEIFELRFGDAVVDCRADSDTGLPDSATQIALTNNNAEYDLVIGIENQSGDRAYFALSGSQWELYSVTDPEGFKKVGEKLKTYPAFFCAEDIAQFGATGVKIKVMYKGLIKFFYFRATTPALRG